MTRTSKKSGGSFAYTSQFTNTLSPCYNPTGQKEIPKLGWHAGGANVKCDNEPTVAEMGVIDKPCSSTPSSSEIAWDVRYTFPKGNTIVQDGGSTKKILSKLQKELESKKKSAFSIESIKGGKAKTINILNSGEKYLVSITDKSTNSSSYYETKSTKGLLEKLKGHSLIKMNKSRKL